MERQRGKENRRLRRDRAVCIRWIVGRTLLLGRGCLTSQLYGNLKRLGHGPLVRLFSPSVFIPHFPLHSIRFFMVDKQVVNLRGGKTLLDLPNEILDIRVFPHLPIKDILSLGQVNKRLNAVTVRHLICLIVNDVVNADAMSRSQQISGDLYSLETMLKPLPSCSTQPLRAYLRKRSIAASTPLWHFLSRQSISETAQLPGQRRGYILDAQVPLLLCPGLKPRSFTSHADLPGKSGTSSSRYTIATGRRWRERRQEICIS